MTNIIVVLPKIEDAKGIKNLLVRNGFHVAYVCTTGTQAIAQAEELNDGIVICAYKLADMLYSELQFLLPDEFDLLLMASARILCELPDSGAVCLSMPLKAQDFIQTVGMMAENIERRRKKRRQQPRVRNTEEESLIKEAKSLLMERNNMSEEEAHRYLQKSSMDSGTNLVETAQMVLSMWKL